MLTRTPADLGAFIRDRRTKLGLDQRSLAQKVGISRKWIVEIEKGKPRAEIGLILRTLKALGVSLELNDGTKQTLKKDPGALYQLTSINFCKTSEKRATDDAEPYRSERRMGSRPSPPCGQWETFLHL